MSAAAGRRAAWFAGGLACVALAGCDGDDATCVEVTIERDATRLRFTREGGATGYVTDVLSMRPGERVTFAPDRRVLLEAGRGSLTGGTSATGEATYTAPADGLDDRIVLYSQDGATRRDRGWISVRVRPTTLTDAPACDPSMLSLSAAPAVSDRRVTGYSSAASIICPTALAADVQFYRLLAGQSLTGNASGPLAAEVTSPSESAIQARVTGSSLTITGVSAGWATVRLLVGDRSPCSFVARVEVLPDASIPDAGRPVDVPDASGTDAGGTDAGGTDAGFDAGTDAGFDAGHDAPDAVDVADVPDAPDDDGVTSAPVTSFPFTDVIPFGLVEFSGGLFWYDNGGLDLHRFDLATLSDGVVLRGVNIALRDLVPGGGRLFWTTGTTSSTQVVAWRPGDAAPTTPLLSGARVFDQLLGDGTSVYAHEQGALQWMLNDGTMPRTALSSSGQRGFVVADGRLYFADLGLFGGTRGVFRVALTPPPSTLLGARETVVTGALVEDDTALPHSLLVDGAYVYGLGQRGLLRLRTDGTGTPTQIARFPKSASPTASWTRMCVARGRVYMVDQPTAALWSAPVDGSAPAASVASPTGGIGFSIVCAADSVWWWSGPRLNRYRLP